MHTGDIMRWIRNLSVFLKVMIVLAIVTSGTVAISLISYLGFTELAAITSDVDDAATEIRQINLLQAATLELSRSEYRLAAEADQVVEIDQRIGASVEKLKLNLERLLQGADNPEQQRMLKEIGVIYGRYEAGVRRSVEITRRAASDISYSQAQKRIVDAVTENRGNVTELRALVTSFADLTDADAEQSVIRARQAADHNVTLVVTLAALCTFGGILIGTVLSRFGIALPLQRITAAIRNLAAGDLKATIPETDRGDEIGVIARTTVEFQEGLLRAKELEAQAERREEEMAQQRKAEMLALAARFEDQVGGILGSVTKASAELGATAQQLAAAVEETSTQSTAVAAAAEQASANVQTVASAAEELSSTISEVTGQVANTAKEARNASDGANAAQTEVTELIRSIQMVEEVIAAINDVAEQTNLLALNATIEAARAGEAGKGFAVVASEVKGLANQTKRMTEEVQTKVDAVRGSSQGAVRAMNSIIHLVQRIDESTSAVAAAVEEQSAATSEISRNATEAASGTQEVTTNISGVQGAAAQTRDATQIVNSSAAALAGEASRLDEAVRRFLAEVRAA